MVSDSNVYLKECDIKNMLDKVGLPFVYIDNNLTSE